MRTNGRRRTVVVVARKSAVLLHRMWTDGTEFRSEKMEAWHDLNAQHQSEWDRHHRMSVVDDAENVCGAIKRISLQPFRPLRRAMPHLVSTRLRKVMSIIQTLN